MSDSAAENIVFMVIRGVVALAIVGVAFYCIGQGLHFFMLPHTEAESIDLKVLGLNINAGGLGAVIFGTGVALCFVALRTAPRRFESRRGITGDGGGTPSGQAEMKLPRFSAWEESAVALAVPLKDENDKQL